MVALWIIVVMLSLLTAVGGALIALRIQYWILERTRHEREAWQQAQESRQFAWEVRQGKHLLEAEGRLGEQVKAVRKEFLDWSLRVEESQQALKARVDIGHELIRLPHVEDIELPFTQHGPRQQPSRWQPPALYRADLRGRDLSHRYLGYADLREATLSDANLYMADLSKAILTGANLSGTNLVGANLSGADLRGANLTKANLLVADLHNAILHGATLLNAQNLTTQQLQTTIYDSTTAIDKILQSGYSAPVLAPNPRSAASPLQESPDLPAELAETSEDEMARSAHPMPVRVPETDPAALFTLEETTPESESEHADEAQLEESSAIEMPHTHKIIELAARAGQPDHEINAEKKRRSKDSGGRGKRKETSRINRISSIVRGEDQQTRAN